MDLGKRSNEANIEELTAAQVKQQTLIATMADGALLLDGASKIVLVNPTARRLFRWEGRNLEGSELCDALPGLLGLELQPQLDAVQSGAKDSSDLRIELGEPARTLRIVLQ